VLVIQENLPSRARWGKYIIYDEKEWLNIVAFVEGLRATNDNIWRSDASSSQPEMSVCQPEKVESSKNLGLHEIEE
jgi:hypothetical protein